MPSGAPLWARSRGTYVVPCTHVRYGEAIFYPEHACGLCGEGKYVLMRKINGKWMVQGESGTWIS